MLFMLLVLSFKQDIKYHLALCTLYASREVKVTGTET